jgi:hypothetical protein
MAGIIQMSGQELTRLRIMIDVADGRLTVESAASLKSGAAAEPRAPAPSSMQPCTLRAI